ncbi:hypothetical protein HJC23_001226 [Cyclotella cryptica]|uniref:PCIF1 WW domain-containing protein n=1 Tax=Cyclotella cryptica TaxID=29204 RepID=A0ABD3QNN3_9STRA|eukprot:CCRYP_003895-RA/>CCRYP_003895-RA protein AED:0.01 eAED:-0.00 QI:0/-1/0/1/-1/1/1/0/727
MPESELNPSSAKKQKSSIKKRKRSQSNELINVCNITGFNDDTIQNDNLLDCLEELATAQVQTVAEDEPDARRDDNMKQLRCEVDAPENHANLSKNNTHSSTPPPPPPGVHQIPNLRIELSRHLQLETLSKFLLQSCQGLRMPSFERWLLDSKLEEKGRYESILTDWEHDPSEKLEIMGKKKKYGRAAMYDRGTEDMASKKQRHRKEKESRFLLATDKISSNGVDEQSRISHWTRHLNVDPILPSHPLETDPSCVRLMEEVAATMSTSHMTSGSDEADAVQYRKKAAEVVKELCDRTCEAVSNIHQMEARLGKYQKFGWNETVENVNSGHKRKKRRDGSNKGSSGGNVDKINLEWHDGKQVCSLVYIPKKKKSHSDSTANTSNAEKADGDDVGVSKNKPKPFVVKLNSLHYHKLRNMFDRTYENSSKLSQDTQQLSKVQQTHVFHALVFAMVIRYSSLAGGQQLNDLRGGGMQGAIHDKAFDCLKKWFGEQGTECFASPFNCHLPRYYSAFSSPDIDGHFGSCGDFFYPSSNAIFIQNGWFEINPPFSPGIMDKMAKRIDHLLDVATRQNVNVTFVVVVPTCQDYPIVSTAAAGSTKKKKIKVQDTVNSVTNNPVSSLVHHSASTSFNRLVLNPCCISHILLQAREHGYVEGSQHLRPTKYKESKYNTSVIVLQSGCHAEKSEGKSVKSFVARKWDAKLFEDDVRAAFASQHKMETAKRKSDDMVADC